jgi:hypothetical protein
MCDPDCRQFGPNIRIRVVEDFRRFLFAYRTRRSAVTKRFGQTKLTKSGAMLSCAVPCPKSPVREVSMTEVCPVNQVEPTTWGLVGFVVVPRGIVPERIREATNLFFEVKRRP